MKIHAKQIKRTEVSHLSLFCAVLALSTIGILLIGKNTILQSTVFDRNSLSLFRLQSVDRMELFIYVLKQRCFIIPCLVLVSTTYLGKYVGYLLCAWYGMGIGIIAGTVLLRYGLAGVLLLLGSAFPQYLFYVPVFVISIGITYTQKRVDRRLGIQILVLELVVFIGCIAESYMNPGIMEKIIKIFGVR